MIPSKRVRLAARQGLSSKIFPIHGSCHIFGNWTHPHTHRIHVVLGHALTTRSRSHEASNVRTRGLKVTNTLFIISKSADIGATTRAVLIQFPNGNTTAEASYGSIQEARHATPYPFPDGDPGRSSPPLRKLEYQRAEFLMYLVLSTAFMSTPHRPNREA